MSNITPVEIINLTARVFGIEPESLSDRYRGNSAVNRNRTQARSVAAHLIIRHTLLDWRDVAEFFGFERTRAWRLRGITYSVIENARFDLKLVDIIETVECQIDQIHESRVKFQEKNHGRKIRYTPA